MASCSGVGAGREGAVGAGAFCAGGAAAVCAGGAAAVCASSVESAAQKTSAKAVRAKALVGMDRSMGMGSLISGSFPI